MVLTSSQRRLLAARVGHLLLLLVFYSELNVLILTIWIDNVHILDNLTSSGLLLLQLVIHRQLVGRRSTNQLDSILLARRLELLLHGHTHLCSVQATHGLVLLVWMSLRRGKVVRLTWNSRDEGSRIIWSRCIGCVQILLLLRCRWNLASCLFFSFVGRQ